MPIDFNINPYNDDFEADNGPRENNYMRILFKPGYAVQARELTQLQSAIQNQIKLFGNHIFTDGTQIVGGHLTYDNSVISVQLEDQFNNDDVDLSDFDGVLIANDTGANNKRAKVIAVDDSQEYKTLMIRYLRGAEFVDGETIKVLPGNSPKATLIAANSTNVGSVISINTGVFYVNGFFVHVPEQTIVLDPYSETPTYKIGLEIDENIVDESADSTLLDPAQESFNYQAPGADRYQFNLVLAKRTLDSIDDSSFFELLRIENGVITKQVKYPIYSEIERTLARRTFDESGNYTVYPFKVYPDEHPSDSTKFLLQAEPGKAYVKGFEFETVGITPIEVDRARTTETVTDYDLSLEFGNYITVKNFYSGNNGIFDTTQFANLDMHIVPTASINTTSFTEYSKTLIGTARAKSIQRNGEKYDLYIVDDQMLTTGRTSQKWNFKFSTSTTPATDPGTGYLKFNNSSASSVTQIYISDIDDDGNVIESGGLNKIFRDLLAHYPGYVRLTSSSKSFVARVQGTSQVGTGFFSIYCNTSSGQIFSNDEEVYIYFESDLLFNVVSSTASTFTFPSTFPNSPTGIYDGVSFTVLNGTGAGQQRRIVTYNSSRVATVDREFDTTLDTSSQIILNYGIKDVDSFVVRPKDFDNDEVYGGQNVDSAVYPSMDVDSFSENDNGDAFLSRTSFDRLIYVLPEYTIAPNIQNVEFYSRLLVKDATFTSGQYSLTLSGRDRFFYGENLQYLSNSVASDNLIVLVKDKLSSTYKNGQILTLDHNDGIAYPSGNGAYRVSDTRIDLIQGSSTFTGDIIATVRVENATLSGSSIVKGKILRGNKSDIAYVDYAAASTSVDGQLKTKIDLANGVVWFSDVNDIIKTPGNPQSLFISDVIQINKIYDSGNSLFAPNSTNAIDITENYLFDTGQRDNYYDHGSIILKDGRNAPLGQTAVLLTYFEHTGAAEGFFARDSYTQADLSNNYVAVYSSSTIGTTSLADTIDFRPRRLDANLNFALSGLKLPYTDLPMTLTYSYYLPRIDKLVATSNKTFQIISGEPSKYPKVPSDIDNTMTLYTVYIPAYTNRANDVRLKFHENRRYTMRDIGLIEKRVERLEYYTQLSLLEKQARDETYFYEDRTIEKEKYGILVDQFDGFGISDNKDPDLICHISSNQLKPYKKITPIKLQYRSNTGPMRFNTKTYSLNYTEKELVSQNTATKAVVVQPYLFGSFNGEVQITPEIDPWVSQTIKTTVVTTEVSENNRPPAGSVLEPTLWVSPVPAASPSVSAPPAEKVSASDSAPQPIPAVVKTDTGVSIPVVVEKNTGEVITESGYNTKIFDNPITPKQESVVTAAAVDILVAGSQVRLPPIPIIPIHDMLGGNFINNSVSGSNFNVEMPQVMVYGFPTPVAGAGSGGSGGFKSNPLSVGAGKLKKA